MTINLSSAYRSGSGTPREIGRETVFILLGVNLLAQVFEENSPLAYVSKAMEGQKTALCSLPFKVLSSSTQEPSNENVAMLRMVALISGLFFLSLAFPKRSPTSSQERRLSLYERTQEIYLKAANTYLRSLWKRKCLGTALISSYILIEPWQAIKGLFLMLTNWKPHFNFYGLNPTSITEAQSKKRAILLLHGNYHSQSAWFSFAKALKNDGTLGPAYTVNLPNGDITKKDFEIIGKKIQQIKEQYKKYNADPAIDLVGHSRGGWVSIFTAWKRGTVLLGKDNYLPDIGKMIGLGSPIDEETMESVKLDPYFDDRRFEFDPYFDDRLFEIVGKYDVTCERSLLNSNRKAEVNTGHMGLLFSADAHQHMIQWLKASL